jgi:ferredoxin-nitrite reductase/sulfite reductase (ferredoxin)
MRELLSDLVQLPPYEQAPELYNDWGEEREFKVQVGRGECAQ